MTWTVQRVAAEDVLALRQAVLRPGQPLAASQYPEDPFAVHLAAVHDERVVGCATFFRQPFPGPGAEGGPLDAEIPEAALGREAWRLRGMATDAALRASGVGSAVLQAGLAAVVEAGGELVWCNARTAALGFYERYGFQRIGSEFLTGPAVKVPHYRAWVLLPPVAGDLENW